MLGVSDGESGEVKATANSGVPAHFDTQVPAPSLPDVALPSDIALPHATKRCTLAMWRRVKVLAEPEEMREYFKSFLSVKSRG